MREFVMRCFEPLLNFFFILFPIAMGIFVFVAAFREGGPPAAILLVVVLVVILSIFLSVMSSGFIYTILNINSNLEAVKREGFKQIKYTNELLKYQIDKKGREETNQQPLMK